MSTDFEWQVDDDQSDGPWQPRGLASQQAPRPPRPPRFQRLRRLPRRVWLAVALVIVAAAGIPAAWLALRLHQISEEQRAAVLNVARLEDRFVAEGDLDALAALQDPRFPGWQEWQRSSHAALTAVVTGTREYRLTWGRTVLNQYDLAAPPSYGAVRLDGERAELAVTRRYRASGRQDAQAPEFDLSVTQYYRFENGGWLRTAPPETIYARMRRAPGAQLRLLYPDVDHALVEPYASYLQGIARRACQDLGCPRGQPALVLSAIPGELLQGQAGQSGDAEALYLPAPALLGVPGNAAGADALARLYAIRLVEAVAAQAIADRGETVDPWLAWELARLGLEAPLDADRLRDTARQALSGGRMRVLFSPEKRTEGVWLMLDFLAGPGGRSPLRTLLADENAAALSDQLLQLLRERNREWWDYLGEVAALDARRPPGAGA